MPRAAGNSAIVTGAARGPGRKLAVAAAGAIVLVNDLGAALSGEGAALSPAEQVVDEIRVAHGESVANGEKSPASPAAEPDGEAGTRRLVPLGISST